MEAIMEIFAQIVYYSLEIVEAIGDIAAELSAIHFPPVA